MASVVEVTEDFARRLRARERRVLRRMLADYQGVIDDLTARASAIGELIEQATLAGTPVDADWVFRQDRVESLLRQAQAEYDRLRASYTGVIGEQAAGAALDGARLAVAQVRAGTIGSVLSPRAIEAIAATTQAGPVGDLLRAIDPTDLLRRGLINGIARGANPRTVAREVSRVLEVERSRALTIARTEMARAQRFAQLSTYKAVGVTTWVWLSARSERTCAGCWAMDGMEFEVYEPVNDHPNGRCSLIPAEADVDLPSRDEAWDRLPESSKRSILGPTRYQKVSSGEVGLRDLGQVRDGGEWGRSVRVTPLSSL